MRLRHAGIFQIIFREMPTKSAFSYGTANAPANSNLTYLQEALLLLQHKAVRGNALISVSLRLQLLQLLKPQC